MARGKWAVSWAVSVENVRYFCTNDTLGLCVECAGGGAYAVAVLTKAWWRHRGWYQ